MTGPRPRRSLVVVGVESERVALLRAACLRSGWPEPKLISYDDALDSLAAHVDSADVVRFESTDEDPVALRTYLRHGVAVGDDPDLHAERMTIEEANAHIFEKGEIRVMRQLHLGRCSVWRTIEDQVHERGATTMNSAAGLGKTFDKRATIAGLIAAGVSVPMPIHRVTCFDDVVGQIGEVPGRQVMVKTAHGAGATGMVALRTDGRRWQAYTTALRDGPKLWNTRRVRSISDEHEIRFLVDAVCRQVVHVEQWLPKASTQHGPFDLRVVVIDGASCHVLMRSADGPFTNLHLGARRGNVEQLRRRMGESTWDRILRLAERAVTAIGGLLYAGVDVVVQSDWSSIVVLEVNGFGDWHPDVFLDGKDTYDCELAALIKRESAVTGAA